MYDENYRTDPAPAFKGMVADMSTSTIISRTVEADLRFGAPVVRGAAANKIRTCTTGDTEIFGFSVRSQSTNAELVDKYPAGDTAAVMLKGAIWLKVNETVTFGDPVKITVATGAIGTAAGVAVAGATFETNASSGELAKVLIV